MNFIDRLKKLFRNKQEAVQETSTTLSLYDVSDIILPDYNNLSNEDKEKVLEYKNNINIENLENIINYDKYISLEGQNLSNTLIKYLDELNEVTISNKKEEELQELYINTSIKNMKIEIIKEKIEKLLYESYLRTIAIEQYKEEYLKKENKFIEIFSRAARIKKNMEIRSIDEAETRSKINIKTLEQQYKAISNAISNNNSLVDRMEIYNKLKNDVIQDNFRRTIYTQKLEYYVDVKKSLQVNFSKLSNISKLLKLVITPEIEKEILKKLAITELELEEFILNDNGKKISELFEKIGEYHNNYDIEITKDNYNALYEETEKYKVYIKALKEAINNENEIDYLSQILYNLRFKLLTFDINNQNSINSKFTMFEKNDIYHELDYYKNIVSNMINKIYQGESEETEKFKSNNSLGKVIKLLNEYLKENNKFNLNKILFARDLLALVISLQENNGLEKLFMDYKTIFSYQKDSVRVPYYTLYALYEAQRRDKPLFYDLYKLYQKTIFSDIYYIPPGIIELDEKEIPELTYNIRKDSDGKLIIFPSTLELIDGDIFALSRLRNIFLNQGLKYIGQDVFKKQYLTKVSFPASVEKIEDTSFNFNTIREIEFQDFKNSRLLYNLLYSNNEWVKVLIHKMFYKVNTEEYQSYIYISLNGIILKDNVNCYILNKDEISRCINSNIGSFRLYEEKIQYNLSKLIEQKTGINIKEYQENSYKQKK